MKKQIFIGGYMHSGTTLLHKILENHGDLFAFPGETRLMEDLRSYERMLGASKGQEDKYKFRRFFADALRVSPDESFNCTEELPKADFESVPVLFQDIAERVCEKYGKKGWVEKTPTNVYFVESILENFPTSKIILIYRDFRDVLASKKTRTLSVDLSRYQREEIESKRLEKDWNVIADAISWNRAIDAQITAASRFPDNVCVVCYESLVREPGKEVRRVCDFIGISFSDRILNVEFSNRASIQSSLYSPGIYTSSMSVWRTVLSKTEIELGCYLTGRRLTVLNYLTCVVAPAPLIIIGGFLQELPGIARRIYKRFKLLGWRRTVQFSKNYLHRF